MYLCTVLRSRPTWRAIAEALTPADTIQGSSRSPQVRPTTRPSAWKGTIIGQSPPIARRRLSLSLSSPGESSSAHLGKFNRSIDTFGEYSVGAHTAPADDQRQLSRRPFL